MDDDFDYEDESDHQDYDANYFDNGEGDDDSGVEEGESALPTLFITAWWIAEWRL